MNRYKYIMDNYECLQLSSIAKVNDWLWCSADNFNGIYRINLETLMPEYITMFEKEELFEKELYSSGIVEVKNKLYFIPGNAGNVVVYDIEKCEMKYIDSVDILRGYHPAFGLIVHHEKDIYLFPLELQFDNYLLKIDIETDQIERIRYKSDLENFNIEKTERMFFGDYVYPKAWMGLGVKGHYGEYNFEKRVLEIRKLELCNSFVYHVAAYKGDLYFLTFDNKVIRLNQGQEDVIWESEETTELLYSRVICVNNNLWILPFLSDVIIKINLLTNITKRICIPSTVREWKRWGVYGRKYYEYSVYKNCLFLFPANVDCVLRINLDNDNVTSIFLGTEQSGQLKKEFERRERSRLHEEDDIH